MRRPAGTSSAQSSRIGDESTRCGMQARLLTPGVAPRIRRGPTDDLQAFKTIERCSSCRRASSGGYTPREMGARLPVIVAMCLAFSSPLQARELSLRYDVSYVVFRVISLHAVSSVEPAAYPTNLSMRTTRPPDGLGRWQSSA